MATMVAAGKYRAKAVEWSQVTCHEKTGNEEIRVLFEIQDGDEKARTLTWRGYFTEKTAERTLESLRYMGWDGDDITNVQGLDRNEVQIVVEHEEYEGKTQVRVAWVNRLDRIFVGQAMDAGRKAAFAQRMRGLVVASKQAVGAPAPRQPSAGGEAVANGDFPFGHQAPPQQRSGGVKL